jgi:hypothetical protein
MQKTIMVLVKLIPLLDLLEGLQSEMFSIGVPETLELTIVKEGFIESCCGYVF